MTEQTVFTLDITQNSSTQTKSVCYGPVVDKVSRSAVGYKQK